MLRRWPAEWRPPCSSRWPAADRGTFACGLPDTTVTTITPAAAARLPLKLSILSYAAAATAYYSILIIGTAAAAARTAAVRLPPPPSLALRAATAAAALLRSQ